MATVNGLNIRLSEKYVGNIINSNNIRTSAHELGHTGGLRDVNLNNNLGVQSVLTNLMTQTSYIQQRSMNPSAATSLTKSQIEAIVNNKDLNKYSAISRRINGFTVESTRSSVGPMPLVRFTYKNVLKK